MVPDKPTPTGNRCLKEGTPFVFVKLSCFFSGIVGSEIIILFFSGVLCTGTAGFPFGLIVSEVAGSGFSDIVKFPGVKGIFSALAIKALCNS